MDRLNMFMMTPTSAKFCAFLLVSTMLAGTFLSYAMSPSNGSIIITNTGVISTTSGLHYTANAVWINSQSWVHCNPNILDTNLSGVVQTLSQNNIQYAIVYTGAWDNPTQSIIYVHSDAWFTNIINAFHAANVKVISWVENQNTMDLSSTTSRNALYAQAAACMGKGFDGFNDDIEDYTGTLQNYIDYLNNLTTVSHAIGKLNIPDVALDWQQIINPHLHVDYIVSMFYGATSGLENSDQALYWQEDFGELGQNTPPSSPIIMGIMNYHGNKYPLAWQLAQAGNDISAYAHPQLAGFSFWLYEYMGCAPTGYRQSPGDWAQWDYWITRVGTSSPAVLHTVTVTSSLTGVLMTSYGMGFSTPFQMYAFTGAIPVNAPSQVQIGGTSYHFIDWADGSTALNRNVDMSSSTTQIAYYST